MKCEAGQRYFHIFETGDDSIIVMMVLAAFPLRVRRGNQWLHNVAETNSLIRAVRNLTLKWGLRFFFSAMKFKRCKRNTFIAMPWKYF